jgi:predicted Zn-dependent peptidase
VEENEKAMDAVVERLKTEKVDAATLDRVKTKVRAGLVRQLDSNTGLASELPQYETFYGDWRVMFTRLQDFEKVTADDVQRVAKQYFTNSNRTVVHTVAPKEAK